VRINQPHVGAIQRTMLIAYRRIRCFFGFVDDDDASDPDEPLMTNPMER
jgi:hypothetical protein